MRWKAISSSSILSFPLPNFLSAIWLHVNETLINEKRESFAWVNGANVPLGSVRLVYSRTSLPAMAANCRNYNHGLLTQAYLDYQRRRNGRWFRACFLCNRVVYPLSGFGTAVLIRAQLASPTKLRKIRKFSWLFSLLAHVKNYLLFSVKYLILCWLELVIDLVFIII